MHTDNGPLLIYKRQMHTMKRFLLTLLKSLPALILLTACGSSDRPFTLKGHFRHLQSGDFYVYSTDPTWQGSTPCMWTKAVSATHAP